MTPCKTLVTGHFPSAISFFLRKAPARKDVKKHNTQLQSVFYSELWAVHNICSTVWRVQTISASMDFLPPFLVTINDLRDPCLNADPRILECATMLVGPKRPGEWEDRESPCIK